MIPSLTDELHAQNYLWNNCTRHQHGTLQASIPVIAAFFRAIGHHPYEILPGGIVHHGEIAPIIMQGAGPLRTHPIYFQ